MSEGEQRHVSECLADEDPVRREERLGRLVVAIEGRRKHVLAEEEEKRQHEARNPPQQLVPGPNGELAVNQEGTFTISDRDLALYKDVLLDSDPQRREERKNRVLEHFARRMRTTIEEVQKYVDTHA